MTFNKWFDTFLSEKGIDVSEDVDVIRDDGSIGSMPIGFIVEHIKVTSPEMRADIKKAIVKLDFINAPIAPFLGHLGRALWEEYGAYIAVI